MRYTPGRNLIPFSLASVSCPEGLTLVKDDATNSLTFTGTLTENQSLFFSWSGHTSSIGMPSTRMMHVKNNGTTKVGMTNTVYCEANEETDIIRTFLDGTANTTVPIWLEAGDVNCVISGLGNYPGEYTEFFYNQAPEDTIQIGLSGGGYSVPTQSADNGRTGGVLA